MNNIYQINSDLTKTQIKSIAQISIDELLENGNPLRVAEMISKMELFIKEIKADQRYVSYVRDEISKFGKTFQSSSGTKIECAEVGVKYDFNNCSDKEWEFLKQQSESALASLKEREEFLKKIPYEGIDTIDKFTGELVHINPPVKTSSSSYKVTISK